MHLIPYTTMWTTRIQKEVNANIGEYLWDE